MALLRWPGGKTRLFKTLWPYLDGITTGTTYAEPFIGGGSVALGVARRRPNLILSLNDKDPDVACFWSVVCGASDHFDALCKQVRDSREITDDPKRRFDYWKQIRTSTPTDPSLRAFRFLLLNKTCWGGQIDQGPMGGWDQRGWQGANGRVVMCQYNVDNVLRNLAEARRVLAGRTTVYNLDFAEFLAKTDPAAIYADPPYFPHEDNKLYRFKMSEAEHKCLADMLRDFPGDWMLSYDDAEPVRSLYDWAAISAIPASYSACTRGATNGWSAKTELVILPPPRSIKPAPSGRVCIHALIAEGGNISGSLAQAHVPQPITEIVDTMKIADNASQPIKPPTKQDSELPQKVRFRTQWPVTAEQKTQIEQKMDLLMRNHPNCAEYRIAMREMYEGDLYQAVAGNFGEFCEQLSISEAEGRAMLAEPPNAETTHTPTKGAKSHQANGKIEDGANAKLEGSGPPANQDKVSPTVADIVEVSLREIDLKTAIQCRVAVNEEQIAYYAERLKSGATFPPIHVFSIDGDFVIVDGCQRVAAGRLALKDTIPAIIHKGSRADAVRFAVGANSTNGVPRSNADKRNAVFLAISTFGEMSDHVIADMCCVSHPFVGNVRKSQPVTLSSPKKRVGKDGKARKLPTKQTARPSKIKAQVTSHQDGAGERDFTSLETLSNADNSAESGSAVNKPSSTPAVSIRSPEQEPMLAVDELWREIDAFLDARLAEVHDECLRVIAGNLRGYADSIDV